MSVYAISDLHLPAHQKPMDIFGPHWENHFERISESWRESVTDDDTVLIPGDITWAMRLEDALDDLNRIGALPGKKIISRGNHDYWWDGIGKVRRALPDGMFALQNDAIVMDGVIFAGTRGWVLPAGESDTDNMKIFTRERLRLEMSLTTARRIGGDLPLCVMLHYPPFMGSNDGFCDILRAFGADHCVYGHLHGGALQFAFNGERDGITYHQVSCDGLDFKVRFLF